MSTNPQRLGKYELLERLGQGGMAEVWKARDTQLQRYVAIKVLHCRKTRILSHVSSAKHSLLPLFIIQTSCRSMTSR
jgi:serine/threonine protein kinase